MGIRGKIVGLFLVTFGLIAGLTIWMLSGVLQTYFDDIEVAQAERSMQQLVRNFEAEMTHLNDINTDWANWDGLYQFAKDGGAEFAENEIGLASLWSARLNLMALHGNRGQVKVAHSMNLSSRAEVPITTYEPVLTTMGQIFREDAQAQGCGLYPLRAGAIFLCWQPVRRSNQTGEDVGLMLMGRLVTTAILDRMRAQSALDFQVEFPHVNDADIAFKAAAALTAREIRTYPDQPGVMTATLASLSGTPALKLRLRFPQDVSLRGREVIRGAMLVMVGVVVLSGLGLMAGIHLLLIRRLRGTGSTLRAISQSGKWQQRLDKDSRSDELSQLSYDVNQLLEVIDKQVDTLEALTLTDALTGIANRRAFDQRLGMELDSNQRTNQPLALIAMDVDYFKRYNDQYGHPAGDAVLTRISALLSAIASRPADLAARIGGEEFAILLPGTDAKGAMAIAEKLRVGLHALQIVHVQSEVAQVVTLSAGVTVAGNDDPRSFLARADQALYQAKASGRDRACLL